MHPRPGRSSGRPAGGSGAGPASVALRRRPDDGRAAADSRPDLPLLLRVSAGLTAVCVGASVVGAGLVGLVLDVLSPLGQRVQGHARVVLLATAAGCVVTCAAIGVTAGALLQKRTLGWVWAARDPTVDEARRVLRLPVQLAWVSGTLWAGAGAVCGVTALAESGPGVAGRVVSSVAIGGLATSALTFQLVLRASRPLTARALRDYDAADLGVGGLLPRLVLTWSLTVGVQLLGALELLLDPPSARQRTAVAFVVGVTLLTGALSTVLVARSLGHPLLLLTRTLRRIGEGRLDEQVTVDDPGEVGLLQAGVRRMLDGLRERERLQDMFGRHVGAAVAREALRTGVALGGERRHAAAVFVDVAGSTALAGRVPPEELVGLLNRLFTVVVDEVESAGGLVNKFEGDGALCVFGAPVRLDDPATAALRAARRIRDRVRAAGELDVGVGVSLGEVVAGQVGARSRLEYTVVGDPVNEAARLTDLAKGAPERLLAAGPAVAAAEADEQACWERRGGRELRGRTVPTEVWAAR